jgi:hypothetical protein
MSDLTPGCTVAPLTKCNSATLPSEHATGKATFNATKGVIALAMRVLERNQCNQKGNSGATSQLQANATTEASKTVEPKSCMVAITKGGNSATAIKRVKCNECEHFLPDNIGDGAGIGTCKLGISFTQEVRGRLALYRHAERRCASFSKATA